MLLKNKISALVILIALQVSAQYDAPLENRVNSPYSMYMTGDIWPTTFAPGSAMGGTALGLRLPNKINISNPASYTSQDTLSFIFDIGFKGDYTKLDNGVITQKSNNFNLSHLAISFKANKLWGGSIGLLPYSKTGYNISLAPILADSSDIRVKKGAGDLNRLYAGGSFNVLKSLSVGANFSYLFGDVEKSLRTEFPDYSSVSQNFYRAENINTTGFLWELGTQYSYNKENNNFVIGALYQPEAKLKANDELVEYILFPNTYKDTVSHDILKVKTIIPVKMGFGFSYAFDKKYMVAFDYKMQDWSNALINGRKDSLSISSVFNFGLQIIPDPKAARNFLKKVNYRAGGFYHKTPIKIRDEQVNDLGVTFGLGIPFKNTGTMFNVACEVGKRGNLSGKIIQENYIKFIFDISFFDFWFYKPKID